MTPTCINSEGTTAKLAVAAWPKPMFCQAKATTLAAINPMVTHWKRIERRGLSSERGMKTTGFSTFALGLARTNGRLTVLPRHPQDIGLAALVDVAAGHKQQIGQAIDVLEPRRGDAFAGLAGKLDHYALGAPAHRACHMQGRRSCTAARQHERSQRTELAVHGVDLVLEALDLSFAHA